MLIRLFLPMVGKTEVFQIVTESESRFFHGIRNFFYGEDGETVGFFNAVIDVFFAVTDKGGVAEIRCHFLFVQLGVPKEIIISVAVVEITAVVEIVKIIAFLPGEKEIAVIFQCTVGAPDRKSVV